MVVISGRKNVYRKLGYVADFCPICRTAQAFLLRRIGRASHLYFISVGKGELAGYERLCQACATPFPTEAKKYKQIATTCAPLPELRASTFPDLEAAWQERLALEARIRNAPLLLSAEDRRELILAPFLLLAPKVERCYSSAVMDRAAALGTLAALALTIAGWTLTPRLFPDTQLPTGMAFFFLGLALFTWQMLAAKARLMRREVLPALARALRPLVPGERELQAAFATVRSAGHKMGGKLRLPELLALLK